MQIIVYVGVQVIFLINKKTRKPELQKLKRLVFIAKI